MSKLDKSKIDNFNHSETIEFQLAETFAMQRVWYIENVWGPFGHNLNGTQWNVLNRLWKQDGLAQGQLTDLLRRDKAFVTRLLDEMMKNGWIERRMDANDRRAYNIFLTPAGRKLKYKLIPMFMEARKRSLKNLSKSEQKQLHNLLEKFQQNLK